MTPNPEADRQRRLIAVGVPLLFVMAFASFAMAVVAARAGDPADGGGGDAAAGVTIAMQGDSFVPGAIDVPPGTTVTWTNADPVVHTVNATDRLFVSDNLAAGDSFSFTFEESGTYDYVCIFHAGMVGTVVVT